jgi:hypothetical protein
MLSCAKATRGRDTILRRTPGRRRDADGFVVLVGRPSVLKHIIHRPMLLVCVLQVPLDQGQVAAQHRRVAVPHDLLQGIDVHARAQVSQQLQENG